MKEFCFTVALVAAFLADRAPAGVPRPPAEVRRIKVLPDKAPDCSSLRSIVETVTRGCATNDEKAIALYNFLNLALYHRQYPSEPGGISALKLINSYGWGLCGGEHTVEAALWKTLGWKWRYIGWSEPGHTTVEAEYDGRWHYVDVFLRFYAWMPDPTSSGGRTIASQADIKATPDLITEGFFFDPARKVCYPKDNRFEVIGEKANWTAPAFLVCGDDIPGIISGVNHSNNCGSPEGWGGITFNDPAYSAEVHLAPGFSLTVLWDPIDGAHWYSGRKESPSHTCGDKDFRNCPAIGPILEPYRTAAHDRRTFSSGRLEFAPDLSSDACLGSFAMSENVKVQGGALVPADASRPASVTMLLASPYVMSRARGRADGADLVELSVDEGKTYAKIDLGNFDDAVGGKYAALVRIVFGKALRDLSVETIVQVNSCILPYLSPGRNKVSVSVEDPAQLRDGRLSVTYAYRLGRRIRSYEQLAEEDKEIARAHNASWDDTVTVVQKEFTAKDLPATFEIDVPTPAGAYPVYPRMVSVRREMLGPGARSAPLPAGAAAPVMRPGDELKTLPNPFAMGAGKPPPRVVRPTQMSSVTLKYGQVVSVGGEVAEREMLRWPKMRDEKVVARVLLVSGDLTNLPAPREIAAARLLVPVTSGHDKAPGQLGAVLLKEPFEKGKAYDFKNLGDPVGLVVIPKQAAGEPEYKPAKKLAIDVTRAIKAVASGESTFHGFGLRIVPNRSVDDGWTVRADIRPEDAIVLEIEVYS